jgi:TfoX/Sxy family transcriptional regulator of competence genes
VAYDERLAERVRELLADERDVSEQRMFGGLSFLVGGNMAVAVSSRDGLLVRVGPDAFEEALERPGTSPMEMGGRQMKGWVFVAPDKLGRKRELAAWVGRGTRFARSLPPKQVSGR